MRLLILNCAAFIFALGLMMVFNTSSAEILDRALDRSIHQAFLRQIVYAFVGLVCSFLVWRIGYSYLLRFAPILLIFISLLLLLTFVPGVGKVRNGAHRWIGIGGFTFQPSEFAKYLLPLAYSDWLIRRKNCQISFVVFFKSVLVFSIPMLLVLVEPDNGSTAVMGASLIPLFFISNVPFKYWALPIALLMVCGVIAAYQLPYVKGRLQVYLHPELDIKGKGHQPHQAKIAAGSGGFLGKGPGASLQKLTYLPEAQNDYIAAIYAEEFGFAGILLLIFLYMLLTFGGFSIALKSGSQSGAYMATSIIFLMTLQAFLNLGVVSGLLPSKGVNLPFFSQGGTSLIANMMALTVLLNIGKNEKENSFERWRHRRSSLSSTKLSKSPI